MASKRPIIDVLIVRDGDAWRLCSAPGSWRTPFSLQANERRDVFSVGRLDLANPDEFIWDTDSPFERQAAADGGVEARAVGRSAVTLALWLQTGRQA
jgi:hypothetical protein